MVPLFKVGCNIDNEIFKNTKLWKQEAYLVNLKENKKRGKRNIYPDLTDVVDREHKSFMYIKIKANNSTTFPASHLHKRKITTTNTKGTSSTWHLHVLYKKRRIKQSVLSLKVFLQKNLVTIEQPFPSDISTWKIIYQRRKMYQIVVVRAFLHSINRGFYKKELSTLITWPCTYFVFDIL